MEMKICNKCNIEKPLNEFRYSNFYYRGECKECEKRRSLNYAHEHKKELAEYKKKYVITHKEQIREAGKRYREKNKTKIAQRKKEYTIKNHDIIAEKRKKYNEINAEKIKQKAKRYRINNKEKIQKYSKEYREFNKDKFKEYNKKYRQNHREYFKQKGKEYRLEHRNLVKEKKKQWLISNPEKYKEQRMRDYYRRRNDTLEIERHRMRTAINRIFRGKCKKSFIEKICCCNVDFLRDYLHKTYEKNYNKVWNDNLLSEVQVDHIVPLTKGKSIEEIHKLCHFSNLQLLTTNDNLQKYIN